MAYPCPVESLPGFISFTDCTAGDFDYVVIGSSFCALGFIEGILGNCPEAKILMIEKGRYHPEFQSLSPEELGKKEKNTEDTTSWRFSTDDLFENVKGINCFVGGRSSFWKAWCPEPTRDEMAEWPKAVVDNVLDYFPRAKKLLSVKPVTEIETNGKKLFDLLQSAMYKQLKSFPEDMEAITRVEHAPLAVIEQSTRYKKYSVVEPLIAKLEKHKNLRLLENCGVTTIRTDASNPTTAKLQTSLGDIPLGQVKLILAMSTLPSATLLLNSFPPRSLPGIGERFTAHFASYVFARVPWDSMKMDGTVVEKLHANPNQLEMASFYIAGKSRESSHQFHIQLNAVAVANGETVDLEEMRHLLKAPKEDMLKTCRNHIVLVCASLGQTDHNNEKSKFYMEPGQSKPTLCFTTNDVDKELWDVMDTNTFQVLEQLSCNGKLEFWNSESCKWQRDHPQIRHKYLVHPASTMWIGDNPTSPVDIDYKLRGVDNVYLTGGALWPTGASWNPTCAMTAMAMHLGHLQSQVLEQHREAVK